jgi:ubiquinone/menaquinone biosynthesis C-methylase UbiE
MSYARYDAVADFCAAGFDSTDNPVSRELFGLPGQVTGLRVLDVACGHGLSIDRLAESLPDPEWDPAHQADRTPVYLVARTLKAR